MELIDTHCHIDVSAFAADYREVLARARRCGVSQLIVPAVDRAGWPRLLEICRREQGCHAALGLHPMYLENHREEDLEELAEQAAKGSLVALGEIGLDYFVEGLDCREQQRQFEQQLRLARRHDLPVLLHVRKAHDQVLALLRRLRFERGGIVHAFSGSLQQARQYVGLGFLISVCGTLTYSRARRVRAIAAELPLTALVLETDSPDIPPAGHRHERNCPEYLTEVLLALADLRPEPVELIAAQTTANGRRLLALD